MILKASTNCEESALVESVCVCVCVPFRSLFFDLQLVLAVCPKTRDIFTHLNSNHASMWQLHTCTHEKHRSACNGGIYTHTKSKTVHTVS